jgi:hypothetical protein
LRGRGSFARCRRRAVVPRPPCRRCSGCRPRTCARTPSAAREEFGKAPSYRRSWPR